MVSPKSLPELVVVTSPPEPIYVAPSPPDQIVTLVDTVHDVYLHSLTWTVNYRGAEVTMDIYDRDTLVMSAYIDQLLATQGNELLKEGNLRVFDVQGGAIQSTPVLGSSFSCTLDLSTAPVHFDELKIEMFSALDEPVLLIGYKVIYNKVEYMS